MSRHTHTYVTLDVSAATFAEIKAKLEVAEYWHVFNADKTEIDMTGIAVKVEE